MSLTACLEHLYQAWRIALRERGSSLGAQVRVACVQMHLKVKVLDQGSKNIWINM